MTSTVLLVNCYGIERVIICLVLFVCFKRNAVGFNSGQDLYSCFIGQIGIIYPMLQDSV